MRLLTSWVQTIVEDILTKDAASLSDIESKSISGHVLYRAFQVTLHACSDRKEFPGRLRTGVYEG